MQITPLTGLTPPLKTAAPPQVDGGAVPAAVAAPTGQGANRELGACWTEIGTAPCTALAGALKAIGAPASGLVEAVRKLPELAGVVRAAAGRATSWALGWGVSETAEEQLDNVEQGAAQNCGALSVVKAMQNGWGRRAARTEKLPDGSVKITQRDGYEVTLTPEEQARANQASGITGDNQDAVEQANLLLAAAAKRYADEHKVSFEEGLKFINGKNWPADVARYFGVEARKVDPKDLDGNGFAIVSNGKHAAIVVRTPDGQLIQDDHGVAADYQGAITSNGKDTGEASEALVIVDVGAAEDKKSRGVGFGFVASWLAGLFGEKPGEGAETGSNGQGPDTSQVATSEAVVTAAEQSAAGESGATADVQTAQRQEAAAATVQETVQSSAAAASASEQKAAEASQEAAQVRSSEKAERTLELQAQMRTTLAQLSISQKELSMLRERVSAARYTLGELESQRELLAGEDFLENFSEIERLDNLSYHVRTALTQDHADMRRLEQEVARLYALANQQEAAEDHLREQGAAEDHQAARRRSSLHQEGSQLRQSAASLRASASGELARPDVREFWSALTNPESLAEAAERRTEQIVEREYVASQGIQANLNFLQGYGTAERNTNGHATSTERALDRVNLALSWLDPKGGQVGIAGLDQARQASEGAGRK